MLSIRPSDREALRMLGNTLLHFGQAIAKHGEDPKKECLEGIEVLARLLEVSPAHHDARLLTGKLYFLIGQVAGRRGEPADRWLTSALESYESLKDKDDPLVLYDLGVLYHHYKRYEEALRVLERAIKLQPEGRSQVQQVLEDCRRRLNK